MFPGHTFIYDKGPSPYRVFIIIRTNLNKVNVTKAHDKLVDFLTVICNMQIEALEQKNISMCLSGGQTTTAYVC